MLIKKNRLLLCSLFSRFEDKTQSFKSKVYDSQYKPLSYKNRDRRVFNILTLLNYTLRENVDRYKVFYIEWQFSEIMYIPL